MEFPAGFDLRAIRAFVLVAESGGMTAAAQRLGTTQSNVSQIIANLEQSLRTPLFDRSVRPIALTAAGNLLLDRGRILLSSASETMQALRVEERLTLPSLTLGLVDSFANTIGPGLVRELGDLAHRWRIWSGITPDIHNLLLSHAADGIVSASEEIDAVAGLERIPIIREPFVRVFPAGYDGPTEPLDRIELPFIRYSLRSFIGRQIEQQINRLRLDLPIGVEFDTATGQLMTVANGLGWSMTTPLCLLQDHWLLDRLRVLPMAPRPFSRQLNFVARQGDLGEVSASIAACARRILQREALPQLYGPLPWIEALITWPRA